MPKIKIDRQLYERIKEASRAALYSSPDEFVIHAIEKELSAIESAEADKDVTERLRGLGYIE